MIIILMGAPGVGKGTQAEIISEKLKIPHISTGEILRRNIKEGTTVGKKAEEFMKQGILVPDNIILELINNRILESDCSNGFILDGFPRNTNQAEELDKLLQKLNRGIKAVFNIELENSKLLDRILGRRVCRSCGATYHIRLTKPKVDNVCDICGNSLEQRKDDNEGTFYSRMKEYTNQTQPLINYYTDKGLLIPIDADDTKENVTKKIINSLGVNA